MVKYYELHYAEKVPKKWLGRKVLQFLQTLTVTGQEMCRTVKGLFETIGKKFKPQHNEITLCYNITIYKKHCILCKG